MNGKIKIGLFVDTYFPMIDGVIQVVHQYATILKDKADVFVACPKRRGYKDNFDYEVIRCNGSKLPIIGYDFANPQGDIKFLTELKKREIDIIHIHSPFNMGKLGVTIAKQRKIPVVATMHSQYKYDFKKATNSDTLTKILLTTIIKTLNSVDELWAVNENTEKLVREYGYKGTSRVMLNATELLPLPDSVKDVVNKKYNLNKDEVVFMFLGRMIESKGIFFIVDVLKELKSRGFAFKMIFVGNGPDKEALEEEIEENNLSNECILTGTIKDREAIAKLYNRADLVVFPSIYDTDGIVKYEAASQSTPTLLLKDTLASGSIIDGKNGFIGENDVDKFADKIIEIINTPNLLKTVSENVRKDLYRTWEERVTMAYDRYLELIEIKKKQNLLDERKKEEIKNKGEVYERAKAITKAKRKLQTQKLLSGATHPRAISGAKPKGIITKKPRSIVGTKPRTIVGTKPKSSNKLK